MIMHPGQAGDRGTERRGRLPPGAAGQFDGHGQRGRGVNVPGLRHIAR